MELLYIIDTHPENGGAPISTCLIAKEFSDLLGKNNVKVMMPVQKSKSELELKYNIRFIEVKGMEKTFPSLVLNPIKGFKLLVKLRAEIKRLKPQKIHVQMPRAAWAIGVLSFLRLIPKDLVMFYTDRDHLESYRLPFKILSLLFIKPRFNEIVCLTNVSANYWRKQKGKADIRVIPNSAGKLYESTEKANKVNIKKKYSINPEEFIVMFSGRMSIHKNWNLAKEIVFKLKENKIRFLFAISTTNEKQELDFNEFKKTLSDANINHVILQNVSQTEITELYEIADVFVLTSDKESFGRTAIEAMSKKCAVIGRDVGGLPEVILKKENILSNNPSLFSERILFYMSTPLVLKYDQEWFFERFIENYTVKANTILHEKMYDLYE